MCTTPEKHTKKRETPRKANQNKTTRRAGYKKGDDPPPIPPLSKEALRIQEAWWNAEQNKNTNNNS